mgnify:CR=1 FL=1|tara:strand:+ start:3327 stop:3509 length:183 start_codon:yes stop_codon:yes gene_type:complete
MDEQTEIDMDLTEPEAKEWEDAWKNWHQVRKLNREAGVQTITIGETVTITVKGDQTIRIE